MVLEGCPVPFSHMKKVVVPGALRVTRLRPGRKYCTLGRLSDEVGWKRWNIVKDYEVKRREKSAKYYAAKKKNLAKRAQVAASIKA